jgi:PAS domain-containing protein
VSGFAGDASGFEASDYLTLFFELLERSSDSVLLVRSSDGVFLEANRAFLSLFQLQRAAVIGNTANDLGLWVDPAERPRNWNELPVGMVDRVRLRVKSSWSEEFTFELSSVRVPWRGEDAFLVVGHPVRS